MEAHSNNSLIASLLLSRLKRMIRSPKKRVLLGQTRGPPRESLITSAKNAINWKDSRSNANLFLLNIHATTKLKPLNSIFPFSLNGYFERLPGSQPLAGDVRYWSSSPNINKVNSHMSPWSVWRRNHLQESFRVSRHEFCSRVQGPRQQACVNNSESWKSFCFCFLNISL